jgi:hypothetical protein
MGSKPTPQPNINTMTKFFGTSFIITIFVVFIGSTTILISTPQVQAAQDTCTWQGGVSLNFSDGGNWTGCDNGGVPEDNDSLVFPDQGSATTFTNDLGAISFTDLTLGNNVTITGNNITVDSNLISSGGVSNIDGFVEVVSGGTINVSNFSTLYVNTGDLYHSGDINITGNGTLFERSNGNFSTLDIMTPDVNIGSEASVVLSGTTAEINDVAFNVSGELSCDSIQCMSNGSTIDLLDGGNLGLAGTNLTLTNDITQSSGSSSITVNSNTAVLDSDIAINGTSLTINGWVNPNDFTNATNLPVNGVISGTGNLELRRNVWLSGNNTYTGNTLIDVGQSIISHPNALGGTSEGTDITNQATLYLTGGITTPEGFFLEGNVGSWNQPALDATPGDINRIDGIIELGGDRTIAHTGDATISLEGGIDLNSYNLTFDVQANINVTDTIVGTGSITKIGDRLLQFYENNSYSGLTTISEGNLYIFLPDSLGTTDSGTIVESGATLGLFYWDDNVVSAEDITLTGSGNDPFYTALLYGSIADDGARLSGTITISGDTVIESNTTNNLNLEIDNLAGSGNLTFTGPDDITVTGSTNNTFDGNLIIDEGNTTFFKDSNALAIGNNELIIEGGILRLERSNQIDDNADVTINSGGSFALRNDIEDVVETIDELNGEGDLFFESDTQLIVGGGNGNGEFSGDIDLGVDGILTKVGTGRQILSGDITSAPFSVDLLIQVSNGVMEINGDYGISRVEISGGTLTGDGSINSFTSTGGIINPGTNAGTLTVTNSAFFVDTVIADDTTLAINVDGASQGSEYDLLDITGDLRLDNSPNLSVIPGYTPAVGQTFSVVEFTGTLTGTFNNLPDGATVSAQSGGLRYDYQISYLSNSITLTFLGTTQLEFSETGDMRPTPLVILFIAISAASGYIGWREFNKIKNDRRK